MKRRSQAKAKKRGNSPYHKYQKTPYRYSEAYYKWRDSVSKVRSKGS